MIEVENGSANVYDDLGLPDAAQMHVKATLAAKIGEIIKHRHLTQIQAAEILGMPQPKLSGMLRGQFRGISEAKMLECMNRLGVASRMIALTQNGILCSWPERSCAS
jgi:predicted XRE-type DNA-binding protein